MNSAAVSVVSSCDSLHSAWVGVGAAPFPLFDTPAPQAVTDVTPGQPVAVRTDYVPRRRCGCAPKAEPKPQGEGKPACGCKGHHAPRLPLAVIAGAGLAAAFMWSRRKRGR